MSEAGVLQQMDLGGIEIYGATTSALSIARQASVTRECARWVCSSTAELYLPDGAA